MPKKRQNSISSPFHRSSGKKKLKHRQRQQIRETRTRRNVAIGLITATIIFFVFLIYSEVPVDETSKEFKTRLKMYFLGYMLVIGTIWSLYDYLKKR